jgi:hypothetical protein
MTWPFTSTMLVLVAALTIGAGQAGPDFSGTWRLDEARSGSPGHADYVGPVVRVIRQTSDTLVMDLTLGRDKTVSLSYPLTTPTPTAATGPRQNRAFFENGRLVTETVQTIQGQTVSTREVFTLDPDGRALEVERVVEVEHGYTLRGGQSSSAVKDVFVRVTK